VILRIGHRLSTRALQLILYTSYTHIMWYYRLLTIAYVFRARAVRRHGHRPAKQLVLRFYVVWSRECRNYYMRVSTQYAFTVRQQLRSCVLHMRPTFYILGFDLRPDTWDLRCTHTRHGIFYILHSIICDVVLNFFQYFYFKARYIVPVYNIIGKLKILISSSKI